MYYINTANECVELIPKVVCKNNVMTGLWLMAISMIAVMRQKAVAGEDAS
jgi:hypothetical protein